MKFNSDETHGRIKADKIGDLSDFNDLYRKYYAFLCLIAEHVVRSKPDAEEIVSDVFVRLWQSRATINITYSIKSYLIKAVHNTALNYIESNKFKRMTECLEFSDFKILCWDSDYPLGHLYEEEILKILDNGINSLPNACREIFLLSRNEDMKYCQIAEKLGISVNTVKTQIKIALGHLRTHMKDYISMIFFLFLR